MAEWTRKWEPVTEDKNAVTHRLKVPNGWVYKVVEFAVDKKGQAVAGANLAVVYVPDADHAWKLPSQV